MATSGKTNAALRLMEKLEKGYEHVLPPPYGIVHCNKLGTVIMSKGKYDEIMERVELADVLAGRTGEE